MINESILFILSRYGKDAAVRSCYGHDLQAQDRALDKMLQVMRVKDSKQQKITKTCRF